MKFNNIEEIRAHAWVGNHHGDHKAFHAIDAFVRSDGPTIAMKAEALRIEAEEGMGLRKEEYNPGNLADEEFVKTSLDENT